ncbi:hypothetical protein ASPVEDRAFT_30098 [Aspergillus versicolor CBS 583.65]|uniref:Mitochondrial import inner membrane translocase subunit TIM22 n=1 Tax=Aspergillus versicolor CBS 583.65 TaxID=1036611 RepID=A0A1L9PQ62_ASPVE|nr:uncharacterized protein ASPVEDRAFT_30098 [Aspergillus versicolor CBS 583.65]OJJ03586.1 hypothetical protein ASPVEDRAFT_30098 [Aspergillus versicolor CBS 583.65]
MDTEQPPRPSGAESTTLYKILHWDKFFESEAPPRLGMEVGRRLPLSATSAFSAGLAIGATHGSKKAAYRFRAENAHRFPTTPTGWFQYHKTKNYISIVGGVKEGMKMGFKLGAGALAFCLFEETVDYARHDQRDFISTVTAGLSFSGIYSLLARHDVYTAARTTKLGLKLSLAYGLMQDALESLKGNRPAYVDFILGHRSKPE